MLDRVEIDGDARTTWLETYEEVFDHRSFTGRSGSMYGYEGIGSIYWHMVAKLLLAVQEAYWDAVERGDDASVIARLAAAHPEDPRGLRPPGDTRHLRRDPDGLLLAHTRTRRRGATGMTGQVKEEILARFGELGLHVTEGRLLLAPGLLPPGDVLAPDERDGSAELTVCAVPVRIETGPSDTVTVERADGTSETLDGLELDAERSRRPFTRAGRSPECDGPSAPTP